MHSIEIDTKSVAIISHETMFWYPKRALQNPANAEKGELYAGQLPARVCPIWLTINGRTPFFFAARSAQNGFVTGRDCFNELGLQRELQQDSLKGRG